PDDALAASISQESAEGSCMSDHAAESVVVSSRPAEVWFARHVMLSWGRASRRRTMAESFVVRREIQVAAPAATIVAFLTDPEKIIRWMGKAGPITSAGSPWPPPALIPAAVRSPARREAKATSRDFGVVP